MITDTHAKVLVSCIGFNPASAVVAARHYAISRAVLLGTTDSRQQMDAVTQQLGVPTTPIMFEGSRAIIGNVRARLVQELNLRQNERIVLDLTGATKLLTIGTWSALTNQPHDRVEVVYLEPNGELMDPISGDRLTHHVVIEIDEVLQWHSATATRAQWQGMLAEVDREIAQRAPLGRFMINKLGEHKVRIQANKNEAVITDGPVLTELPRHIRLSNRNTLRSSLPGYFSRNIWLEEVCLHRARRVFGLCDITRAAAGQHLTLQSNATDEADVVLVRGPRICIIEAKARLSGRGAGNKLEERIRKTKRYFGSHASVVFVHPAWGQRPPPELVERTKGDATLVGANWLTWMPPLATPCGSSATMKSYPHRRGAIRNSRARP